MEENLENVEEGQYSEPQVVEKKKKPLTQAQLANLEKMRHKKAVKTEAKKLIQSEVANIPQTFVGANGSNEILQVRQKYEEDLEEVREIKNYLKEYFEYKQQKSEMKKKRSVSPEAEYKMTYNVKI